MIWGCDSAAPIDRDTYKVTPEVTAKTTQCVRPFNSTSETITISSAEELTAKLTATPGDWDVHVGGGWAMKPGYTTSQQKLYTHIKYEKITADNGTTSISFKSCQPVIAATTIKDALHISKNYIDISFNKRLQINQALDNAQISAARQYQRDDDGTNFIINELIASNAADQTFIKSYNNNMKLLFDDRTPVPMLTTAGDGGGGGESTQTTSRSPCFDYLDERLRELNLATDEWTYYTYHDEDDAELDGPPENILTANSPDAHVRFLTATEALFTITLMYSPPPDAQPDAPKPYYLLQGEALRSFLKDQLSAFEYRSIHNDATVIQHLYEAGIFYQRPKPTPSPGDENITPAKAQNKAKEKMKNKKDPGEREPAASSQPSGSSPSPRCAE